MIENDRFIDFLRRELKISMAHMAESNPVDMIKAAGILQTMINLKQTALQGEIERSLSRAPYLRNLIQTLSV